MKRRKFGLLASTSLMAFSGTPKWSSAQTATPDASLLKTTLTPQGAERAGNAAGTIPAWTGGMTSIPAGFESWDPTVSLPPDFFAGDAMLYEVDASNLAQYADLLSEGLQNLIKSTGFSLQVYPTRRPAAAPQWVYDFIVENVGRAQLEPGGGRLGFNGGYGGVPFPIPYGAPTDTGAQIVWNHQARWGGSYQTNNIASFTVPHGQVTLVNGETNRIRYPYYNSQGGLADFDGYFYDTHGTQFAPSTVAGGQFLSRNSSNPLRYPQISWQVLPGQGRVRKSPEVEYDTPSSYADGIINYDEYFGFDGPMDEYDWTLIGKKEMLIPYNNNKIFHVSAVASHGPKFFSPDVVRWELHRVWVVEAKCHPGKRNVLARRRLYLDEDTWMVGLVDSWDGNDDILRHIYLTNATFPNLPGTIFQAEFAYNLQTGDYLSTSMSSSDPGYNGPWHFDPLPPSLFNPQAMAAAASY